MPPRRFPSFSGLLQQTFPCKAALILEFTAAPPSGRRDAEAPIMDLPPLLANKHTDSPSVFVPSTLLREARRQKGIAAVPVAPVCVLDPDGDLVRRLRQSGAGKHFPDWPCYHTEFDAFLLGGRQAGIVGRVVGASFA